jgi:hypothetical protein
MKDFFATEGEASGAYPEERSSFIARALSMASH